VVAIRRQPGPVWVGSGSRDQLESSRPNWLCQFPRRRPANDRMTPDCYRSRPFHGGPVIADRRRNTIYGSSPRYARLWPTRAIDLFKFASTKQPPTSGFCLAVGQGTGVTWWDAKSPRLELAADVSSRRHGMSGLRRSPGRRRRYLCEGLLQFLVPLPGVGPAVAARAGHRAAGTPEAGGSIFQLIGTGGPRLLGTIATD